MGVQGLFRSLRPDFIETHLFAEGLVDGDALFRSLRPDFIETLKLLGWGRQCYRLFRSLRPDFIETRLVSVAPNEPRPRADCSGL